MATKKTTPAPEAAPAEPVAPAAPPAKGSEPVASAEAPKKKSNTALIVILIIVFLFVVMPIVSIAGITFFVKNKVKDATKNGITIGTGSDSVSLSTTENQKWPTTIPATVPKFTAGKIQSSGRIGSSWTLTIAEVKASDLTTYRTTLVNAGWTISSETDLGGLVSYTAEKGDWTITPMFTSGENSMVLSVMQNESTTTTE